MKAGKVEWKVRYKVQRLLATARLINLVFALTLKKIDGRTDALLCVFDR